MAFFLSGSTGLLGRDMYQMEKISTGIAYGTSAGSAGYWFYNGLIRLVRLSGLRLVYWEVWFWAF